MAASFLFEKRFRHIKGRGNITGEFFVFTIRWIISQKVIFSYLFEEKCRGCFSKALFI